MPKKVQGCSEFAKPDYLLAPDNSVIQSALSQPNVSSIDVTQKRKENSSCFVSKFGTTQQNTTFLRPSLMGFS